MHAIETTDLTKAYGTHLGRHAAPAVNALDLAVKENEVYGFLGRNGAGKTTAIKMLCSLLIPSKGSASVMGEDVRKRKSRRLIGYLPENPYFYEYLSTRESIDFYGQLSGLNKDARTKEWDRLSELLDLRSLASQRVRTFSKGMRQRLGFAIALVSDPPVLVLDEPMSGLDPLGRRMIRELILKLRDEGKTIFFSSHVLGDVEQICDRVGIIVKGEMKTQGRLDELLTRKVKTVEVIAKGLSDDAAKQLEQSPLANAAPSRKSEAGHHLYASDIESADALVRQIHSHGASLADFIPVKESLEDYFMREQTPTGKLEEK